jgi:hypothetical protein
MIKKLTDAKLLSETKRVRSKEKHYTLLVLEHLQEVENRKLYCELGISSLFKYCIQSLKYSEAEATIRVNATRLITCEPKVKEEIQSGLLSLTHASELNKFFKRNPKVNRDKVIKKVAGTSTRKVKDMLRDKKQKLKIHVPAHVEKKLAKVKNDFQNASDLEIFEILLDRYLEAKQQTRAHKKHRGSKNQRYISRKAKESIYNRAGGRCEHHTKSGKRCDAYTNLQYDHIRPLAQAGGSEQGNLRLLCFAHNQRMRVKNE